MGITWGIVEVPSKTSRETLLSQYRPLAVVPMPRQFAVLHGNECVTFRRLPKRGADGKFDVAITAKKAPTIRKVVDALKCSPGNHDSFEPYDGVELYVPWVVNIVQPIRELGSAVDGLRADRHDALIAITRTSKKTDRLAAELSAAAIVAKQYDLMIRIDF